ncbi:protein SCO1/2 [Silvimonas terrae]|uniref:Protein SCO1/2 n=1 Tax=Silvimonas terrae TaxID=300266 RepID=A0A840RKM8_9NEIS|nr:SCO family protein [Silvimonas terrae]MBB5192763.1 protein SCO1/2 [Silvimonas terrae]
MTCLKTCCALLFAATLLPALADDMVNMPDMPAHHHPVDNAPAVLPGDSVFQVPAPLTDQGGQPFNPAHAAPPATLFTVFYGDCQYACPIIVENLKQTVAALSTTERSRLRVVMISLNPGIDTPEKLAQLAQKNALAPGLFSLVVAKDDADTRLWAAALGVKYRRATNGDINHSTRLVITNRAGVPVADNSTLAPRPDPDFMQALHTALQ